MLPMQQELRIRRELTRRGAAVVDVVGEVDGIQAAREDEGLGDAQALTVRPRQGHTQFLGARAQHEGFLG